MRTRQLPEKALNTISSPAVEPVNKSQPLGAKQQQVTLGGEKWGQRGKEEGGRRGEEEGEERREMDIVI